MYFCIKQILLLIKSLLALPYYNHMIPKQLSVGLNHEPFIGASGNQILKYSLITAPYITTTI